ncbi:heparinase II/III family protein [Enterococcus hulanensis]|uniref:heparinase II/III domain-containing protein n=1 Tax=Enterococcus hulanensis TaxID=2559929 RepID=UPI00288D5510|nr:heparinase II/III family protein [Enterococcus hulanensis]MDT2661548.1 heparinase II/III family protein [Enterococcus hulanensis]
MKLKDFSKNVKAKQFDDTQFVEKINRFISTWQDDPSWLSGWRHNYFCDLDGSYLHYDETSPKAQKCPTCGRIYRDEKKNNAWVTITRNKTISMMRYATVLYLKTGKSDYLEFVKKTLLFFTTHYSEFEIHIKNKILPDMSEYERVKKDLKAKRVYFDPTDTDWSFGDYRINFQGPGKIMAQGLSEAVALIRMLFCYSVLQEKFSEEEQQRIKRELLAPAIDFLDKQQFIDHNITLWREAAIQIMKLVNGDFEQQDFARPYGIYSHIEQRLTEDGFWYEGSVHYHHYVLEALGYLSYFMTLSGKKDDLLEEKVEKMLQFSYQLAFDNGIFPNPNDGWPNVNLKTYLNVFELAAASYPQNETIQTIYQNVLLLPVERVCLPIEDETFFGDISSTGLLILTEEMKKQELLTKKTVHFLDSKISVLRNKSFNIFLKYGVNSLSHAHYDPLNIEFTIDQQLISKDLSNVGYGSELVHRWYNTPLGHNSVIIDEQLNNIRYHADVLNKDEQNIKVQSEDIYPGSRIVREINVAEKSFVVETAVQTEKPSTIDIVQHFDIPVIELENAEDLVELADPRIYTSNLNSEIVHSTKYAKELRRFSFKEPSTNTEVVFHSEDAFQLYVLETLGNPSNESRTSIIIRFSNKKKMALFMSVDR